VLRALAPVACESGRFAELWLSETGREALRLGRRAVKLHLCNSARAKDQNVRVALLDRNGSTRQLAIGTKARCRPLYGVTGHSWAALAVGVAFVELRHPEPCDASPANQRIIDQLWQAAH
jgi:hypothetical protein